MGNIEDLLSKGWKTIPELHGDGSGAYYAVKATKAVNEGTILVSGTGVSVDAAIAVIMQKIAKYEQEAN